MCSAKSRKLSDSLIEILKPVVCQVCNARFPDALSLNSHSVAHAKSLKTAAWKTQKPARSINPLTMSVKELKAELHARGCNHTGTKDILQRRLETVLVKEC